MKRHLAPLALIPFLVCITVAQEKIIARVSNRDKIAKVWNSINPAIGEVNTAMAKARALLHERFNPKVVLANPDEKRRETVAHLKAAREALYKELEAINVLIEEEDY